MRMQVEYEYEDGKRGLRLFDIPEDADKTAVLLAAEQTAPATSEVISVKKSNGIGTPYDERHDPPQP